MAMSVSQMQSALQKLQNELNRRRNTFSKSQQSENQKAVRILKSNVSKLQKLEDKQFEHDRIEDEIFMASTIPVGMEYYSETELMDL